MCMEGTALARGAFGRTRADARMPGMAAGEGRQGEPPPQESLPRRLLPARGDRPASHARYHAAQRGCTMVQSAAPPDRTDQHQRYRDFSLPDGEDASACSQQRRRFHLCPAQDGSQVLTHNGATTRNRRGRGLSHPSRLTSRFGRAAGDMSRHGHPDRGGAAPRTRSTAGAGRGHQDRWRPGPHPPLRAGMRTGCWRRPAIRFRSMSSSTACVARGVSCRIRIARCRSRASHSSRVSMISQIRPRLPSSLRRYANGGGRRRSIPNAAVGDERIRFGSRRGNDSISCVTGITSLLASKCAESRWLQSGAHRAK
jgi:hypothetical protein